MIFFEQFVKVVVGQELVRVFALELVVQISDQVSLVLQHLVNILD